MEIKKIIAGLMAFTMCVGFIENPVFSGNFDIISVSAEEETEELTTGSCGENVTYSFDAETGTLTISGTGKMESYWVYESPFCDNENIKKVIIEDGVESIGECAFYYNESLTEITIPDSVTYIGWGAFDKCSALEEVTIPDGVTSIEIGTFNNCINLTEVTIPDGVTHIGAGAFWGCKSLKKIKIPENVTIIESSEFGNCINLKEMTIPKGVTEIYGIGYYYDENDEAVKVDGFTIKGYVGTAAETYAKENEFEFIALEKEENPPVSSETGDVDGDGEITSEDALKILQMIVGLA